MLRLGWIVVQSGGQELIPPECELEMEEIQSCQVDLAILRITGVSPEERQRLIKLGKALGQAIEELITTPIASNMDGLAVMVAARIG